MAEEEVRRHEASKLRKEREKNREQQMKDDAVADHMESERRRVLSANPFRLSFAKAARDAKQDKEDAALPE